MGMHYSHYINLYTILNNKTVSHIINRGAILGLDYRTSKGDKLDKDTTVEYILNSEDRYRCIQVDYYNTWFDFVFFGYLNQPPLLSIKPPNTRWILPQEYGLSWIDNARYARLFLYLCKDLPIEDFVINREDFTLPSPNKSNTINISGGFGPREESKANAEILVNNIYYYGFKPTDKISTSNLESLIDYALKTDELLSFDLELNRYIIKISISDLISITAVEPYAKKIIDNKEYIDVAFYVEAGFKITDTFLISTISSNFEAPINI